MKATFSRSKKEAGKWMVRAVATDPFEELPAEGSEVDVELKSGDTKTVKLTKQVWQGTDNETGQPLGLYALD